MSKPDMKEELERVQQIEDLVFKTSKKILPPLPPTNEAKPYLPMNCVKLGTSGDYSINKTEKHNVWHVINLRNAYFYRVDPEPLPFAKPTAFHTLKCKGSVMTSDEPNERYTQYSAFHNAYGHVLVSGLGLGMAAGMLLNLPKVISVTVIEKEQDVITLTKPYLRYLQRKHGIPKIVVIKDDIFHFLDIVKKIPQKCFDYAYHDIWYGTAEGDWKETVVPLYRACRRANIEKQSGWCVYDMYVQLMSGLMKAALFYPDAHWKPYRVFIEGLRKCGFELPYTGDPDHIVEKIKLYLLDVGSVAWETTFDWDHYEEEEQTKQFGRSNNETRNQSIVH